MYDLQTELELSEQNRRNIYDEVRNEHLANRIHRAINQINLKPV
jgi:hypothetical protein